MEQKRDNPENSNKESNSYYDLSEEASIRPDDGTSSARNVESDDLNEKSSQGPVSSPKGDGWAENKVATSLDDE